jgi:hypothetical protein
MAVFHCQGLSLAITQRDGVRICMLNSTLGSHAVPYHLPSLFVRTGGIVDPQHYTAPMASVSGRWDKGDDEVVGWDLSGLKLSLDGGTTTRIPPAAAVGDHPVPRDQPDWSDLRWVIDARRFLPGATLRDDFRDLSPKVSAAITATGVEVKGGAPINADGGKWVWFVRPGLVQAVTDTLDLVTSSSAVTVDFTDGAGRDRGHIVLAGDAECWLINEAPRATHDLLRQLRRELTGGTDAEPDSDMPDHKVYFEAFDDPAEERLKVSPKRLYNYADDARAFDTGHCMLLMVNE